MDYEKIARILNLNRELDLKSAEILNDMVDKPDLASIEKLIKGKYVIIFGAGPSLEKDIKNIKNVGLIEFTTVIAVDGALTALIENEITPDIIVTDLDGDIDAIIEANNNGVIVIVHAHGDNIEMVREIVPKLKNVIGTTQIGKFDKLRNFGGFTDGDRAVYMAEYFNAELIFLAGMDFGSEIGRYSGKYDRKSKIKKLMIGRKLLEKLAMKSKAVILNLTSNGEDLMGIPRISVENARKLML